MSTLDEVLAIQKQHHILQAPPANFLEKVKITATASTLNITLQNNTDSSNCWAYITGLDVNNDNAVFILQSDGVTPYYPTSPSTIQQPLQANCHIQLGAPGTSRLVTVPQLVGARVWLCKDAQLTFLLNPGPAVVEPSVTNPTDANYNLWWSFAEFTFNSFQLFANITYVDFVSMPISLTLVNGSGAVQTVPGIPSDGLATVCSALQAQDAVDGAGWSQLIVKHPTSGALLRVLSPNSAIVMNPALFAGYYDPYVAAVWAKYASDPLTVDTQTSQWGTLTGRVTQADGTLSFPGAGAFSRPSARDIFACDSGAFGAHPDAPDPAAMANITARLAAALNRSTLLANPLQPAGEVVATYYADPVTNHYARVVHAACPDGRGYAFPYDDVDPDDAANVAGTVADGDPASFVVSFGGLAAVAGSAETVRREVVAVAEHARSGGRARQLAGGGGVGGGRRGRIGRRGLEWAAPALSAEGEEKAALALRVEEREPRVRVVDLADADLERGFLATTKSAAEMRRAAAPPGAVVRSLERLLPAALRGRIAAVLGEIADGPASRWARPALGAGVAMLRLSVESLVGRVLVLGLLLLGSFLLGVVGWPEVMGGAGSSGA